MHRAFGLGRRRFIGEIEFAELFGLMLHKPGEEGLLAGRDVGLHGPVFLGSEFLDLDLAIDDKAQRHRLDATGRAGAGKLAPKDRR